MATDKLPGIQVPRGSRRLPDNEQWQFRFEVKSASSNRVYIISQNKTKRFWACSCPGWKAYKKCKHLSALGLPNDQRPYEVQLRDADGTAKRSFLEGYKRYDTTAEGYGESGCWRPCKSEEK